MAEEGVLRPQNFGLSVDDEEGFAPTSSATGSAGSSGAGPGLQFMDTSAYDASAASSSYTSGGVSDQGASSAAPSAGGGFFGFGGSSGASSQAFVEDEPDEPLLDELGIHPSHILKRTLLICQPWKSVKSAASGHRDDLLDDNDMAGPLLFCFALGFLLLLQGKMSFGYIYGVGMVGCVGIYALLSMMVNEHKLEFFRVVSYLGYSLLPIVFLAVPAVFITAQSAVMYVMVVVAVVWATRSAASLFVAAEGMDKQRYLIAYPIGLFYLGFALIAAF
uniref:Protein YIPF n=1 Tax=Palpitomonas bilix TaxID=652834 RepID=A0A7S3D7D5_9EUKA